MWRWIIRIWISIVMFWFLMFMNGLILNSLVHLFLRVGVVAVRQGIRDHPLLTMFLLGLTAGLPELGSNFTGEGWFRSKSGPTYEGFKLETIKRWMWLLISPVLMLAVVVWSDNQRGMGMLSGRATLSSFFHEAVLPNCSSGGLLRYRGDTTCSTSLLTVGVWLAAIGYSLAPAIRMHGAKLLRTRRNTEVKADQS